MVIDTLPASAVNSVNLSGRSVGSNLSTADVTWEVVAPAGVTITQTSGTTATLGAIPGLTSPTLVTFRARSVVDPSKTATSSITIVPPVVVTAVSLVSDDYSLSTGQSAALSATVATSGAPDTAGVTYAVSGPGTLSGSGLDRTLVATGIGTITVTATSIADPTKFSTVTIGVGVANEVTSVSLVGTSALVGPLGVVNLTAIVNGTGSYSGAVSYTIVSGPGTLVAGTLNGINTPATLTMGASPTSGTTVIEARSVADPTKFDTFSITLAPDASVTTVVVSPSVASIAPGQAFTATATVSGAGPVPQAVTWTVTGPATFTGVGNTINVAATGPGTIVVTATSVANPGVSGQASVVSAVIPTILTVTAFRVGGLTTPIVGGSSASVDASVTGTGLFDSGVTWTILTGPGSITPGAGNLATYAAPSNAANGQQVILRAVAQGDPTKFSDLTLNLNSANVISSVVVTAAPLTTTIGNSVNLNATVLGSGVFSQNVLWSIDSGSASLIPGAANAPTAVLVGSVIGTVVVRATSVDDPTKSGTVSIGVGVVPAVSSVVLDKTTLTLVVGDTATVDATVLGVGGFDGAVTWAIDPITNVAYTGDATASVSGNRLNLLGANGDVVEIAGGQPSSVVFWTATSVADPTKKATVAIRTKALVTGIQITTNRTQIDAFGKPGIAGSPNFQQAKLTAAYLGSGRLTPPSFSGPGGIAWTVSSGPGIVENTELGVGFVNGTSIKMLTALDPAGVIGVTASQVNLGVSGSTSISNISAPLDPAAVVYIGSYPYTQDEKLWLSREIVSLKAAGTWNKLISLCIPGFSKNLIHAHTSLVNTTEPKNTPVVVGGVMQTHQPFGHEFAPGLGIRPIGGTPTGFTKLPWTEADFNAISSLSFGVGTPTAIAPPFSTFSGMDMGLFIVGTGIGQPNRAFELTAWAHISGIPAPAEFVAGRIGSTTEVQNFLTFSGLPVVDTRGYVATSREGGTRKFYRNGLVSPVNGVPYVGGTSNTQVYLGARNQPYNGLGAPNTTPHGAEFLSHRTYSLYFIGNQMTDADHVAMNSFTFNLLAKLGI
ncbi:MAG: beta strand repeat-containing protein [Plesiomonas shigelloides]